MARRRPAIAALMGLVILLACGLVGGGVWWASWLGWHHRQLELQIARADQEAREAPKQRRIAEDRRHQADRYHYAESLRRVRRALDARQFELAQDILHDVQAEPDSDDPRGFAWRYLWRGAHHDFSQLWGHEATVVGMSISRNGSALATWDLQDKVLLWDISPVMELDKPRVLPTTPHAGWAFLGFLPDGRYLATLEPGSPSFGIDLFEVASGRLATRLDLEAGALLHGPAFDSDSRRLAVILIHPGGRQSVDVWDAIAGPKHRPIRTLERDHPFRVVLSPDGARLAVSEGEQLALLDPWTGRSSSCWRERNTVSMARRHSRPTGDTSRRICRVVASWCGRRPTAARPLGSKKWADPSGSPSARRDRGWPVIDGSGHVMILDRTSGQKRALTSGWTDRAITYQHMVFSPDETRLSIGIATTPGGLQPVHVWDIANARPPDVFPGRKDCGYSDFLPDGRTLILAGGTTPRIWRLDPPTAPEMLDGHTAEAWAAAFSPDGKVLATGSDDTHERRTIKFWDPASGRLLAGWKGHTATVSALAFSPDGHTIASVSLDSGKPGHPNVILWDVDSHRRLATLDGHTGHVRSVAFSPDGRWLASASDDRTARLWDVTTRTTRAVLSGHSKNVTCVAFSPDGKTLASASNDTTVRLWDVATGGSLATLRDVGNTLAVAFAPDGSLLASANEDGSIKLWDPSRRELVRTIRGEADQLRCLAFTPDGRNVVAAGKGKVIRTWDVATGQELLTLEEHTAQINALAFAPDGSTLASCSHDGSVRLWRAGPIRPVPSP